MGWAVLVSSLQILLKKTNDCVWTDECDKAFTGVKHALTHAPVLALPDSNKPFEVICDACGIGLGAVLLQDGRPIAFEGKRMSPAEQNNHVGEQELLAVVHALELWRCYLDGTEFTVVTDHSPNTFFDTKKLLSPRQARWAERLPRFQFTWEYRPGRVNVADPLSRHPTFAGMMVLNAVNADSARADNGKLKAATVTSMLNAATGTDIDDSSSEAENAAAADAEHVLLSDIIQGYTTDPWFADKNHTAELESWQGLYYKGDALVVPDIPDLEARILKELHDANYAGHCGYHRTTQLVRRMYWWPAMATQIREYVQGCFICQQNKHLQRSPAGKLMPLPIPSYPWEWVTADRITNLPKTKRGHTAILVVVDRLTKMAHFAPCKNQSTATDVAQIFTDIVFKSHGVPEALTTDRGPEFTNKLIAAMCEIVGTKHRKSTAYHPQTDGQTERMNRVLEDMLRHYVSPRQDNWDDLLAPLEFAVNNAFNESIQDTPFYLNYGRHPRLPTDLNMAKKPSKNKEAVDYIGNIEKAIARAKVCLQAAQQRQKKYADAHRVDLQFNVGDKVFLSSRHIALKAVGARKMLALWLGPFEILARPSNVNYELKIPEHYQFHPVFHVSMLRPCYDNGYNEEQPPMIMIDGEEEFELSQILQHRPLTKQRGDSGIKYLVKWKGYGPAYNSWEPESMIKLRAPDTLSEYWDEVAAEEAVQATQPITGSDSGLAPGSQSGPATRSRGTDRGSLKPVTGKLKRKR